MRNYDQLPASRHCGLGEDGNGVGTLLKRGGMAGLSACFRSPTCRETVLSPAQYLTINLLAAELMAKTPGLQDNQALLLAVTKFIAGDVPEGLPGRPGDPIPPVGLPPSDGIGKIPETQLPGQSGQIPNVGGVPGQENNGPAGGTTTTSPLPEEQGLGLIFNEGAGGEISALQQAKDLFNENTLGTIRIGAATFTELPKSGNAAVFSGANDAQIQRYFLDLSGAAELPIARDIPGKGKIYVVTTPLGNFNLRDFASSTVQGGNAWTIDIPGAAVGKGYRPEIKFLR